MRSGAVPSEPNQIVRTVQKSHCHRKIQFWQEWRSVSGAIPVLLWMRS